jgi:uncharacterized membrane protein
MSIAVNFRSPKEPPVPDETAQNGLSESAASGIAYLTFIPAIIFLVVAPYNTNPNVKFHAWQSIFLTAAWFAIWIVLVILGFIPFLNLVDIVLIPLTWLGFIILWLIVMIQAFQGKRFTIPLLGPLAAKQAGV